MISISNPQPLGGDPNDKASVVSVQWDALNSRISVFETVGTVIGSNFLASSKLPATRVDFYLSSGAIFQDGPPLQVSGQPATLTAAQLAAVNSALATFQKAVETELVALGIFAGTVS